MDKEQQPPGPVMAEVYDDGMYTVDAGVVQTVTMDDGSLARIVRLHIANRSGRPLVISSLLGVCVDSGGERVYCVPLSAICSGADIPGGIDGLVEPDGFVDGWAAFPAADSDDGRYTMRLAVDYAAGEWIEFELSGQ